MNVTTVQTRNHINRQARTVANPPTGQVASQPSDAVTLSGKSEGKSFLKKAVPFVAGAAGLAAGIALGAAGGVVGAVAAVPAAAAATIGAGALGLVGDIAEGMNGTTQSKYAAVGIGVGLAAGSAVVAAGAVGGVLGAAVVGAATALMGAGLGSLIAD